MSCVFGKTISRYARNPFRYFSAHCCAWKHTVSHGGSVIVKVWFAVRRSFSALRNHDSKTSLLGSLIENRAEVGGRIDYGANDIPISFKLGGSLDNDIFRIG